jgi:two-component system chemotaxis sensor kinase CheA
MVNGQMFDGIDADLLAIFFEEAREQIDALDQGLVQLEHTPDDRELIQGIFRAAHTLKGSSGAMGLRVMANLTHAMEDVLDQVREGRLAVTADIMDQLLHGLDLLRSLEQALEAGENEDAHTDQATTVSDHLRKIARATESTTAPPADQADPMAEIATDVPDDALALLIQFADDCAMPSIRAYMVLQAVQQIASVVQTTPSQEEIDAGHIDRRQLVMVTTDCPEEVLRQAILTVSEVEWVRIAPGGQKSGLTLDMPARDAVARDDVPKATSATPAAQTVRVNVEALDRILNLVGELVLDRTRISQLKDEIEDRHPGEDLIRDLDMVSNHLGSIVGELHEQLLEARMLPVSNLFNRFPRLIRDLSRSLGKEVELVIEGENEQLDRSIIERLVDPLTHLLRNAIDHGMEMPAVRADRGKSPRGRILLTAYRKENHVIIEVVDDGPGLPLEHLQEKALAAGLIVPERVRTMTREEICNLIFASGLSTADKVSDVSGRGVGMDVVRRNVEALGGTINVSTEEGMGSRFSMQIPLTLAIVRALIIRVGDVPMALPLSLVEETIQMSRTRLSSVQGSRLMSWRDRVVPVIPLAHMLPGCGHSLAGETMHLVAVRYEGNVAAFAVDAILGHQEIVVKSLGSFLGRIPGLAGATILGNGHVALILDMAPLFSSGLLKQAIAEGQRESYQAAAGVEMSLTR